MVFFASRLSSALLGGLLSVAVAVSGCSLPGTADSEGDEAIASPSPSGTMDASKDTGEDGGDAASTAIAQGSAAETSTETTMERKPLPTSGEISVEGEPMRVVLTPYQPEGVPIEMSFPKDLLTPVMNQGLRWTEVSLMNSYDGVINEDVYLTVVWPRETATVDQALEMAIGDRGWTQQRGISLIDSTAVEASPNQTVYPWERRRWRFEKNVGQADFIVGEVILGELDGQGFWTVTHFPVEYAEGFGPRMNMALKTLRSR